jgi:Right handed beta helix region
MNKFCKLLLGIVLITIPFIGNGQTPHVFPPYTGYTYYVDNVSGSDANNGRSPAKAWATLHKVTTSMGSIAAGTTVLLKRGETFGSMTDSLVISSSGTAKKPIIFGAYGVGANPIITGFSIVSGWTSIGTNLWESTSAVSNVNVCNIVSINGVNTGKGRFPKNNSTDGGYTIYQSYTGSTTLTTTSSNFTGTPNWTGAEIVIKDLDYIIDRRTITAQSGGSITFDSPTSFGLNANYGFFVQNDLRCCTQQNDWYYNPTTKKIDIYSTTTPTNVKLATTFYPIQINGSYVTIKSIDVVGANAFGIYNLTSNINHLTINACNISYSGEGAINIAAGNYTKVYNCTITNTNDVAIALGSNRTYCEVKNCNITNTGLIPGMGNRGNYSGIAASGAFGLQLWNNRIISTGFNPITVWGDSILIKNNFVDTFCTIMQDGGGVYVARPSLPNGTEINGNIIINGPGCNFGTPWTTKQAQGVYVDVWTNNYRIYNNSIGNCNGQGIQVSGGVNTDVEGNTVYNCTNGIYNATGNETINKLRGNNHIKYNIFVCMQATGNYRAALYHSYSYPVLDSIFGAYDYDYNIYSKPLMEYSTHYQWDETFQISDTNGPYFYSLVQWQALSGKDTHSTRSPQGVSSISEMLFLYNDRPYNQSFTLTQAMLNINGTAYPNGTIITLLPFTSMVLMNNHNP